MCVCVCVCFCELTWKGVAFCTTYTKFISS